MLLWQEILVTFPLDERYMQKMRKIAAAEKITDLKKLRKCW
jgi:hypothetical protein